MKKLLTSGVLGVTLFGVGVTGICLTTGNCQSSAAPSSAPATVAQKNTKALPQKIRWHTSLESALKESKRTGKPIFADFYATWCPPCKMLEEQTYPNAQVIAESHKWVMLKIDTDKQTDLAVKYGIASLPTLAVLRSDGKPVNGTTGFLDAPQFIKFLRDVRKNVVKK